MHEPNTIIRYLDFIQKELNIRVMIKDRTRFLSAFDKSFSFEMLQYFLHNNAFCTYVKSDFDTCRKCIKMADYIDKKCIKTKKSFKGECYAGVVEYIVPILTPNGDYLGFIIAGSFKKSNSLKHKKIISYKKCFDEQKIMKTYQSLPLQNNELDKKIIPALEICANYIGTSFQHKNKVKKLDNKTINSSEDYFLSRIVYILSSEYKNNIMINDVSQILKCSNSYISHIFKKNMGFTIKSYINWLRVEEAKKLLKQTEYPISKIAYDLGYHDSNYFSKVFASFEGKSPSEYRIT